MMIGIDPVYNFGHAWRLNDVNGSKSQKLPSTSSKGMHINKAAVVA